jgi:CSLREA domain-containing protein
MRYLARGVLVTLAAVALSAAPAAAATFTVDSGADAVDANPGDGACASASNGCTLRAAVQEANAHPDADQVDVPAGTYQLTLPGAKDDADLSGDLDVTAPLTVVGAGGRSVVITAEPPGTLASGIDRIFDVLAGGSLTLSKATLDGGQAPGPGGIIRAAGPLSLSDATVQNGFGAAGGGIWASAPVSLDRVTVTGNHGDPGGGIVASGGLTAVNSTVALNYAYGNGGGIAVTGGSADIASTTLAMNQASGSGSVGGQLYNAGVTQIRNSILERNGPSAPNCGGNAITSGGHNVDDDGSCGFAAAGDRGINFFGWTTPQLVNAGGETDVLLPFGWPGSLIGAGPAVDIGGDGCPPTDQRGVARPQGASCDAGAYEAEFADLVLAATTVPAQARPSAPVSIVLTLRNDGPSPATPNLTGSGPYFAVSQGGTACLVGQHCFGTLAPGQSVAFSLTLTAGPAPGPLAATIAAVNDAPIGQAALDPNDANSKVAISIPIVPALKRGACANARTGTRRSDALNGTAAGDLIRGGAGNDKLFGLAGDDCLDGGSGNDLLDGGPGNDKLTGGPGKDTLKGGTGNDVLNAADHGKDVVDCGPGRDRATVDRIDRVRHCEQVKRKR